MTEAKLKRQRVKPGDVLLIDLGDGRATCALVSTPPLVVFFDFVSTEAIEAELVLSLPVAFKVWVFKPVVGSGRWPRIGRVTMPPDLLEMPMMFMQDALSGALSLYHHRFADTNFTRSATLSECAGLECAAVWNANHIEERLRARFDGGDDKWAGLAEIDVSRVPDSQKR